MTERSGFSARTAERAALRYLAAVVEDAAVKPEVRLKAAGMLLERAAPKPAARAQAAPPETVVRFEGALEEWSR